MKDLDLERKRTRIHRTWTTDRESRRKLGPVKTWVKRWLPLTDFIVAGLRDLTAGRNPEDFVFTSARGSAVDGRNWRNRVWEKTKAAAGLTDPISVHDLRHVAATNTIAAGTDVKLVQRMLGHKDTNETLNTLRAPLAGPRRRSHHATREAPPQSTESCTPQSRVIPM